MSASNQLGKIHFVCQTCGFQSPKWLGKCPDCNAWNTLVEEKKLGGKARSGSAAGKNQAVIQTLLDVAALPKARFVTDLSELDNVLGGGVVPGSLILVGGDPGIGKSTLLLQTAFQLSRRGLRVLYVSGEESLQQIKLRANRLGEIPNELFILCETNLENILDRAKSNNPAVMIMDSIQTLMDPQIGSAPGSVSQVRECGSQLMLFAKHDGPAIFLVGHVTKEGALAGPKILEHLVDTVLYFEGDRQHGFRILRTVKNRFGSTNEIGVFEMTETGLQQIGDPSRLFLSERRAGTAGSVVTVSLEGQRPILIELQSLVIPSYFGMPQRRVSGLDYNRCCLLLAVLERRGGIPMAGRDVFFSVAGGLNVEEPAVDLAILASVASSAKDQPVDATTALFGEVGLGGEIRAVSQPEKRLQEVAQLGFKRCLLPRANLHKLKAPVELECIGVDELAHALQLIFP